MELLFFLESRLVLVFGPKLGRYKVTEQGFWDGNGLAQHLEHFLLGVYDGRELRSREGLTDVFIDGSLSVCC